KTEAQPLAKAAPRSCEPRVDEGVPLSQATRLRRCVGRLRSGCLPGSRIARNAGNAHDDAEPGESQRPATMASGGNLKGRGERVQRATIAPTGRRRRISVTNRAGAIR